MNNKINNLQNDSIDACQTNDSRQQAAAALEQFLDSVKALECHSPELVILQHPQEKKEMLATVPLLLKCLPAAKLKIGLSWPNLSKITGKEEDYSRWAVIYLGTQAESEKLKGSGSQISVTGKLKNLSDLRGIIVLDGSWREAKTLWWRNPWLLKLNRIVLNPEKPAIYNALRKEPRKESVSTLEAVAITLAAVLKRPDIYDQISSSLAEMARKFGHGSRKRKNRRRFNSRRRK